MEDHISRFMEGTSTKYYYYKKRGSGNVTIPVKIAEALNWTHKQDLALEIKVIEGEVGIFLRKKGNE